MSQQLPTDSERFGQLPSTRDTVIRVLILFAFLYLFILSITLLGESFKLFGKEFADGVIAATSNPLVALMIGILATATIQSSSTTTSMVVGLVGSGVLPFSAAVPMIMGANIGTSVTNTIVSLGSITRSDDFRRAFSGSILHDCFNLCSVAVILPLQIAFDIVGFSSHIVEAFFGGFSGTEFKSPLAAMTKPLAKEMIHWMGDVGWISALVAGLMLFVALNFIVKILKSMVLSRVEQFFQRYVFRNAGFSFMLGIALTVLVQSSSITTSLVVPLIGAGVLTLAQIYPYTLGANIGTTITAFLASFVTGSHEAVAVAFSHLLFNVYGMALFWPLKRLPMWMAVTMANLTMKSRLYPVAYILTIFYIIPGLVIYFLN